MLSPQTIQIVKATAGVVAEHAETITRRFYALMFAGNQDVQDYFNPAHQRSGGQQRALAGAICAYAANIDRLDALGPAVELIAQKHCSLGIQPEHYPIVGKHLLAAIKDVLGDAATDEIVAAWAEAYGLLAQVFIDRERAIYGEQRSQRGGWNGYRAFRVERKVRESELVTSFCLRPADGGELPHFKAGQYITVRVDDSGTVTPRNYSLSDRPGLDYFRISVKRECGPSANSPAGVVSNYLHDSIGEGDELQVGPPCGEFTLDVAAAGERTLVFMSGGIGITPVLAMLKDLDARGYARPVWFIHAARNSRYEALAKEAREIAARRENVNVQVLYDAALADDLQLARCDREGRVTAELLADLLPSSDAEFYYCGPEPFMAGLHRALHEWGVPADRTHFEFFGPQQDLAQAASRHVAPRQALQPA